MKNPHSKPRFLATYRENFRNELDKREYGLLSMVSSTQTSQPVDRLTSVIVVAAMVLIFASSFLVH